MGKFKKSFILSLILMLIVISSSIAFAGIPEKSDSFYVADYANVISKDTENHIISKNGELENLCGGQIVVVTVDFLDGMDIEDYAYKIFKKWEIGDKKENNGVLLLLAIGEEDYWCMQGKGFESSLSSSTIADILWEYLEPDFATGDYDAGVLSIFNKLYDEVSSIYGGPSGTGGNYNDDYNNNYYDDGYNHSSSLSVWVIIKWGICLIIIITIISIILGSINRRNRPRPVHRPPHPPKPPKYSSAGRESRPPRPSGGFGGFGSFGGGGFGGSSSHRSSSSRSFRSSGSSRSSGGGFRGGMGRGGGGMSRGGGAGRRGK